MSDLYVIVQAGGRGSRLRHHTWNKPKCLVSVQGKPIIYHLFDYFPEAKFIVIGDYLFDKLEQYMSVNVPAADVRLIKASEKGTASGIATALELVPKDSPLVLTWSDLIINSLPAWPQSEVPVVCTTSAFTCRWTVADQGYLHESPCGHNGVPGLFYFSKAGLLPTPPVKGEFVRWFAANVPEFFLLDCSDLEELGDFSTIEKSNDREGFCRFFNKVEVRDEEVIKTVVDPDFAALHQKEVAWYKSASDLGFRRIPAILGFSPFTMKKINGRHAYQMFDLGLREQRAVMSDYLDSLISLHDLGCAEVNVEDVRSVYIEKTLQRVRDVADIIPGFNNESMTVNGRKCRNPFSEKHTDLLESFLPNLIPDRFSPIHGDATFSNTLVDDNLRVWFIDPRGYFSKPGIMGDAWYDFAKVYYSAVGGYDAFNRRKFKLFIDNETVEILMEEPLFRAAALPIFKDYFGVDLARIKVLHALIWFSFAGYAKDDIDSVIGAFYLGLYWLEEGAASL